MNDKVKTPDTDKKQPAEVAATVPTVGYLMRLAADLGNGRQLEITGNLPKEASRADFDAELDKLCGAVEKKQNDATIPALEDQIAGLEDQIAAQEKSRAAVEEEFKGKDTPVQEKRQLQNHDAGIDALKSQLKQRKALLEKIKPAAK